MATGKYQTFCTDIFNHFLVGSSETVATAADVRMALCTGTGPHSASIGTQLSATGYTAGGLACDFDAPVEGDPTETVNDTELQWTNSGGTPWTQITGYVVHRGGGTLALATAMYFLNGLAIDVPAGATLTFVVGVVKVQEA